MVPATIPTIHKGGRSTPTVHSMNSIFSCYGNQIQAQSWANSSVVQPLGSIMGLCVCLAAQENSK